MEIRGNNKERCRKLLEEIANNPKLAYTECDRLHDEPIGTTGYYARRAGLRRRATRDEDEPEQVLGTHEKASHAPLTGSAPDARARATEILLERLRTSEASELGDVVSALGELA